MYSSLALLAACTLSSALAGAINRLKNRPIANDVCQVNAKESRLSLKRGLLTVELSRYKAREGTALKTEPSRVLVRFNLSSDILATGY